VERDDDRQAVLQMARIAVFSAITPRMETEKSRLRPLGGEAEELRCGGPLPHRSTRNETYEPAELE
jgi:hypothetical protein